jgi:hypothetical protein
MAYWQDDTFDTWPEVYKAGTAAIGLYNRCGVYCARELTDGTIPAELVASYGTREWAQKLVDAGLWETEGSGYRDVYYLVGKKGNKLNPTREEALKKLREAADRTARWRANANKKKGVTRHVQENDASRDGVRDASSDASPSLPPSKEGKGDARPASRGEAIATSARPSTNVDEDPQPVDWRTAKAFGVEPDPGLAHTARVGAAAARAAIRKPVQRRDEGLDAHERLLSLVPDPPTTLGEED